jgi:hypothetical protein
MQPLWLVTENTIRGKVVASPSSSRGESCESVYAHGSFVHQKCSNSTLTNLLFGLCKFVWIINPLVTCPSPHPRAPACPPYHNLRFRLMTKVRACRGTGQKWNPGITFHAPGSVGGCEGMNAHTPKWAPTLGVIVPMDSQIFKEQFRGQNSLDWKAPYTIGNILERKCLKWACTSHLSTWNINYCWKKGWESNSRLQL